MKRFILVLTALTLLAAPAQANLWSAIKNSNLPPKTSDAAYRIETQGLDVRVYEFTPETAPHMTCMMTFSETGATSQCFPKIAPAEENN